MRARAAAMSNSAAGAGAAGPGAGAGVCPGALNFGAHWLGAEELALAAVAPSFSSQFS